MTILLQLERQVQTLKDHTVVFVGGGNMASALIDGLLSKQNSAISVGVIDPNQHKLDAFTQQGVKTALPDHANELLNEASVVVLAVKPQVMAEVCQSIKLSLQDKLVISVAAGLTVSNLVAMTGCQRLVRTMPNLPATVGYGATGLYANDLNQNDKQLAQAIMQASGVAVWVDQEEHLHAVTAVAGSAPAYFFYVLEQMIDKAVQMGLSYENAHTLATQTMHGSALMAKQANPADLRAKVTSKGGTTHAAIRYFDEQNTSSHIFGAMQACYDRSVELGS